MPARLKPTKYRIEDCHRLCAINPQNLPAGMPDMIHRWYEAGDNTATLVRKSDEFGYHIGKGSFENHKRKHLVREDHLVPVTELGGDPELDDQNTKLSELEILDRIIQAGAKGLKGRAVRITPEMTMKAMELRLKLTQGSVHDDFMAAVAKAMGGGDAPEVDASIHPRNREQVTDDNLIALVGEDERRQGAQPDAAGE